MPDPQEEMQVTPQADLDVPPDANDPAAQVADETEAVAEPDNPDASAGETQSEQPTEPDKPAPPILVKYWPQMAGQWKGLNPEQREALVATLAEQLDASRSDAPGDGSGNNAGTQEPATPTKPVTPSAAEALLGELPADVTEAEIDALVTDGEISAPMGALVKKLATNARWNTRTTSTVGKQTLDLAYVTQASLDETRAERDFEKAINDNATVLSALDEATYTKVCQDAQAMKRSGEAKTFQRAIQLAMLDNGVNTAPASAPPVPPQPPNPARARREAQASSLGTPARRAPAPRTPEVRTLDDIGDVMRAKARELGINV